MNAALSVSDMEALLSTVMKSPMTILTMAIATPDAIAAIVAMASKMLILTSPYVKTLYTSR